jgi:hypothetical protein
MAPPADPFPPMIEALRASGPAPAHADKLMQFGRFVGSWSLDVIYYDEAGAVRLSTTGEWHFGWVLEGRAVQDVWIVPPRNMRIGGDPPPGEYGASFRHYDPTIDAWRSTWHGPVNQISWPFIARQVADEMVLERIDEQGELVRWIFSKVTHESFHWRAVRSADGGQTWRLEQEMHATRIE